MVVVVNYEIVYHRQIFDLSKDHLASTIQYVYRKRANVQYDYS